MIKPGITANIDRAFATGAMWYGQTPIGAAALMGVAAFEAGRPSELTRLDLDLSEERRKALTHVTVGVHGLLGIPNTDLGRLPFVYGMSAASVASAAVEFEKGVSGCALPTIEKPTLEETLRYLQPLDGNPRKSSSFGHILKTTATVLFEPGGEALKLAAAYEANVTAIASKRGEAGYSSTRSAIAYEANTLSIGAGRLVLEALEESPVPDVKPSFSRTAVHNLMRWQPGPMLHAQ